MGTPTPESKKDLAIYPMVSLSYSAANTCFEDKEATKLELAI